MDSRLRSEGGLGGKKEKSFFLAEAALSAFLITEGEGEKVLL